MATTATPELQPYQAEHFVDKPVEFAALVHRNPEVQTVTPPNGDVIEARIANDPRVSIGRPDSPSSRWSASVIRNPKVNKSPLLHRLAELLTGNTKRPSTGLHTAARVQSDGRLRLTDDRAFQGTISHLHRCIFVHVPKTAGRSVSAALGLPWTGAAHRTLRSFRRRPDWRDYFIFTVVRNPWDRFVSMYHFICKDHKCNGPLAGSPLLGPANTPLPFRSWLTYNHRHYKGPFNAHCDFGGYALNAGSTFWFSPQRQWLLDETSTVGVQRVLRFEDFEDEFSATLSEIGVPCDSIPWENKGPREDRDYRECYDDVTRELVADLAAEDIEAFGYTF